MFRIPEQLNKEAYSFLASDKHLGNNIMLLAYGGSIAYGTNLPTSDIDVRGIALNSRNEVFGVDKDFEQVCGYHVLSRLFMKGMTPDERGLNEVIDQVLTALQGASYPVRRAAVSCLQWLGRQGEEYAQIIRSATKSMDLGLF
jgi:hypothetical protein